MIKDLDWMKEFIFFKNEHALKFSKHVLETNGLIYNNQ